ncbi:hypothetical protein HLK59_28525 [Streptomyces sp. S3(2020)]|uniref:hypothetical protein n=1 Tax=Streptomyces sp. S3(2020) TaxID=2732044 RepID=UPI0014899A77|nr:hypothetical protein [Streptomyces sp. S3(2020)]NNN34239.1 hypothetical protein [Streptomyces sp. S3(2020)]
MAPPLPSRVVGLSLWKPCSDPRAHDGPAQTAVGGDDVLGDTDEPGIEGGPVQVGGADGEAQAVDARARVTALTELVDNALYLSSPSSVSTA